MSSADRVSVVIVLRNDREVDETLMRLKSQVARGGHECLVVDSSEGRLDQIAARHPWVRWIPFTPPLDGSFSIAAQRNAGIAAAAHDVIAFIDASCLPNDDWLELLTNPIRTGSEVVTCGPVRSVRPDVFTVSNDQPDGSIVASAGSGNLAFDREVINRVGLFDERFAYGSDIDWTLRATEAGVRIRLVRDAEIRLDYGPRAVSIRRSFRYGRGRTRMLRLHPRRILEQLRSEPDWGIYPLYLIGTLPALIAGLLVTPIVPIAYGALLVIPLVRHRHYARPFVIVFSHLVSAVGVLAELFSSLIPAAPTILHYPFDPGPYQAPLNAALVKIRVRSAVFRGPTPLQSLNLLLLPVSLISARVRGTRIWHLHWTWGFLPGGRTPKVMRRAFRAWFSAMLHLANVIGLRIVWTAHNIFPHAQVFDDDIAARRTLLGFADAVVVHHESTATELKRIFPTVPPTFVAPQGPAPLPPLPARADARLVLGIVPEKTAVVFTGRILPYKGVPDLLQAIKLLSSAERQRIALRIAGKPLTRELQTEIEQLAQRIPDFDYAFNFSQISDEEYVTYLAAADVAAFPFRWITNSGSVITALSAGTPVIAAGHPALRGLPAPAALTYDPLGGVTALASALVTVLDRDGQAAEAARESAASYASAASWSTSASVHRALYARLLQVGQ